MTLRPKLCQNCHIAQVVAKIELGSGAETDVLWVCRSCTLELQKHDASMQSAPAATGGAGGASGAGGALTPGDTPQQSEFKTDDLEKLFQARMGRPINQKVNDLPEHYKALIAAEGVDNEGNKWNCIDIEFTFIEYITGISLDQLKDCTLLANQVKNRYANVVAPDPSRVRLSGVSPNDYINANWIPGRVPSSEKRYIGAQGPLPNTVEDFWRMVFETNVSVIVMLTQVIENERVKCEPYWPDGDTPAIMYGQVTVRLIASQVTPEVTTRTFDLTHPSMNNAQRRVTHLQYTEWPDFGQPSSCAAFLSLVTNVDTVNNTSGPLLTHCSAGIGRTGTFIVVHAVLEEYRYYHQKKLPLTFNLIEVLTRIRAARPGMVQTKDQLQFCYRALCEAIGAYNDVHGPPAKVRTVTVKPLPPSDRPPAAVLAAASKIDIVPYSETDAAKRRTSDDSDDESSSSSSSGDAAADRRRRERGSRSSKSRSSSGDPRRRRHDRRSGGGGGRSRDPRDRSRDGGRSSSNGGSPARTSSSRAGSAAAASPSVLDQALAEAKSKVKANANKSVFLDV